MGWRTVIVTSRSRLSLDNNNMVIQSDKTHVISIPDIELLLIESMQVSVSSALLCALIKSKVKIIFCDETHNPFIEAVCIHEGYNSHKKIQGQIRWSNDIKDTVWNEIIVQKISNQATVLKKYEISGYEKLEELVLQVKKDKNPSLEEIAAKLYFSCLFGEGFTRDIKNDINAMLNYGYSIIMSSINKVLSVSGYITELGIHHSNQYNHYNLACDFMEPFRPLVDSFAYTHQYNSFDTHLKHELVKILDNEITYIGKNLDFQMSLNNMYEILHHACRIIIQMI